MSDLQKAWAKGKLGGRGEQPAAAAVFDDFIVEEDEHPDDQVPELPELPDDDSSSASSASSTGTIVPSPRKQLFARPQGVPRGRSMEPIPWTTYFERELFLTSEARPGWAFHAYFTSPVGNGPLFVMHHGGGSSGLSFAVMASEIKKRLPAAGILSVDARGHGSTTAPPEQALDLTLENLTADLVFVILTTKAQMHWEKLPSILLIGHSLGGAVVTNAANVPFSDPSGLAQSLVGYMVLDVVEGSAMDALQSMMTYLSTRPSGFASLQSGIEWHVRSRTIRDSVSARTSVPGLLAAEDGAAAGSRPWRWRTDLAATQPFWEGWFVGLSKKFLGGRGGKMLLLAGTDRLDTELTIGQMQGKYALQVFPEAGHFIHEDVPEKTAATAVDFFRRNDRGALVLPPKVSELLRQGKKV